MSISESDNTSSTSTMPSESRSQHPSASSSCRIASEPMPFVLILNGGSSSIRFAIYRTEETLKRGLHGKMDRIGLSGTKLAYQETEGSSEVSCDLVASDHQTAASFLMNWLEQYLDFKVLRAVGHRVVHGMQHSAPARVTQGLIDELERYMPYDREHLPSELELIKMVLQRHPDVPQVACFDTAFHHNMPRVAKLIPIPRRYEALGVQRYGFHGLSYSYVMQELASLGDPAAKVGRVILAHLGNGASLAAVRDGQSIDTSMGFTPTAGLVMGTRSGDLDPGLLSFLSRHEQMTPAQFDRMVNQESGLLGISETSSDMRDLLAREAVDARAAEAVELFCYQTKKWIGSFAAALGGLDTLVFTGGIGESSPQIRNRICLGLEFLGIELDESRNAQTAAVISKENRAGTVRVIGTDEELIIARSVCQVLDLAVSN